METQPKLYVAGGLFDRKNRMVALVTKNRPEYQAGKLNLIGGKVEENEYAYTAMVREFLEETGYKSREEDWELFCELHGRAGDWIVYFFRAFTDDFVNTHLQTMEDEEINWHDIEEYEELPHMKNLKWLIPLALDADIELAIVNDIVPQ